MTTSPPRRSHRLRTVLVLAGIAACVAAVPVAAVGAQAAGPTAASTAQALRTAAAGLRITTAPATASTDGSGESSTGPVRAAIGGSGSAGVAAAQSRATGQGVAACSAVLGSGGTLAVADDGTCSTTAGSGDVVIPLTDLVTLRASSIVARCSVRSPGGAATADVELVGARIETRVKAGLVTVAGPTLALVASGPSTPLALPGVLSVVLNSSSTSQGSSSTPGSASATALTVTVQGLADVVVASADCGVPTFFLPSVPLHGVPLSAGMLGVSALVTRRWWLPAARQLVRPGGAAA